MVISTPFRTCSVHRRLLPRIRRVFSAEASLSTSCITNASTVFSGIQPTGVPHLGNYLGALKPWVQLQNSAPQSARLIFCIVDLHALTTQPNPARLSQWRVEAFAALLAVGLNPERCTIFFQSEVSAHAELMWALCSDASMGYLSRMTQWKSKLALPESASIDEAAVRSKLRLGLFAYPVLQAADVLLHGTTHVPVGQDQKQHLEFAREIAQSFNRTHGDILAVPQVLISHAKRVMSLSSPNQKMSKSTGNDESRILLTDGADVIRKKIKRALTDSEDGISYDPVHRPGVSNLLEIIAHLEDIDPLAAAERFQHSSLRTLKEEVATVVIKHIDPITAKLKLFLDPKQQSYLREIASAGSWEAQESSRPVLRRVYEAIGLSH